MFEKVSKNHPDKIADRIAGAIVDLAYSLNDDPKVACEVLIGHGDCYIINETSQTLSLEKIEPIVKRISGDNEIQVYYKEVPQDFFLAKNQKHGFRCGDNGIFKGTVPTKEEIILSNFARSTDNEFNTDGKYILADNHIIICQSGTPREKIQELARIAFPSMLYEVTINPLGDWTGGLLVDSGATNRKLGSDMGHSVTGGGLHGKDLSKADVSVNIYAFLKAYEEGEDVELYCGIGDKYVDGRPYSEIVEIAKDYIKEIGGFEKFAEYGLL
jgi:S-adenosylmethionine synthetase